MTSRWTERNCPKPRTRPAKSKRTREWGKTEGRGLRSPGFYKPLNWGQIGDKICGDKKMGTQIFSKSPESLMGHEGIEPSTFGLRVRCSAS